MLTDRRHRGTLNFTLEEVRDDISVEGKKNALCQRHTSDHGGRKKQTNKSL